MALKKEFPTPFGVNAEYWNISRIEEDYEGRQVLIHLQGYINAQARADGAQPISNKQKMIYGDAYSPDMTRAEIYALLKQPVQSEDGSPVDPDNFDGAEDA